MTNVSIEEAAARFGELLAAVEEKGETILICREGKPVAELKAASPRANADRLQTCPDLKPLWMAPDFDPTAPLSDDEWPEEYRFAVPKGRSTIAHVFKRGVAHGKAISSEGTADPPPAHLVSHARQTL